MRIHVVSALFPPDIAEPSLYVKTLLSTLSTAHSVSATVYATIPENVPNCTIYTTSKRRNVLYRLWSMTKLLYNKYQPDTLYVLTNAPSVELPFLILHLLKRPTFVYVIADAPAYTHSREHKLQHYLTQYMQRHAKRTLDIRTSITSLLPIEKHLLHPVKDTNRHIRQIELHCCDIVGLNHHGKIY